MTWRERGTFTVWLWLALLTGLTLLNLRCLTQVAPYYVKVREIEETQVQTMERVVQSLKRAEDQLKVFGEHIAQLELKKAVTHR